MNNEKKITEHNKKKKWVKPELKVLGMKRTLGGTFNLNPTEDLEYPESGAS